jgi:hypothetical protein
LAYPTLLPSSGKYGKGWTTIVIDRNAVAHGRETPGEVGRRYTLPEINELVRLWDERWMAFIDSVEAAAGARDFYRLPR